MQSRFFLGIMLFIYCAAVTVYLSGTYGWFGFRNDALAGLFLAVLGMPWVLVDVPHVLRMPFTLIAPLISMAIVWAVLRMAERRENSIESSVADNEPQAQS